MFSSGARSGSIDNFQWTRNVVVQIPRHLMLERGGIINIDGVSIAVGVQLLTVVRQDEAVGKLVRSAGELPLVLHLIGRQVEVPEFAAFVAEFAAQGSHGPGVL